MHPLAPVNVVLLQGTPLLVPFDLRYSYLFVVDRFLIGFITSTQWACYVDFWASGVGRATEETLYRACFLSLLEDDFLS